MSDRLVESHCGSVRVCEKSLTTGSVGLTVFWCSAFLGLPWWKTWWCPLWGSAVFIAAWHPVTHTHGSLLICFLHPLPAFRSFVQCYRPVLTFTLRVTDKTHCHCVTYGRIKKKGSSFQFPERRSQSLCPVTTEHWVLPGCDNIFFGLHKHTHLPSFSSKQLLDSQANYDPKKFLTILGQDLHIPAFLHPHLWFICARDFGSLLVHLVAIIALVLLGLQSGIEFWPVLMVLHSGGHCWAELGQLKFGLLMDNVWLLKCKISQSIGSILCWRQSVPVTKSCALLLPRGFQSQRDKESEGETKESVLMFAAYLKSIWSFYFSHGGKTCTVKI